MDYRCTEEMFLRDIKDHSMKIIKDDGVNRHIRFSDNGSSCYFFELITWPGHLCIAGDCGTYVFRRLTDMFEFFRSKRTGLHINAGYWGEKLESIDRHDGYKKFSHDVFIANALSEFMHWIDYTEESEETICEVYEQLNDELLCDSDEFDAVTALRDWDNKHLLLEDFWEHSNEEYSFRYIWCLYAVAYGVKTYDQNRKV